MYKEKLTLTQAISMEEIGDIMIIDASSEALPPLTHPQGGSWKENYIQLRTKFRHISPDKLLSTLSSRYIIEVPVAVDLDSNTFTWRYLHGLENAQVSKRVKTSTEYVYVLVNAGYPDLVKIGMTTDTVEKRVASINNASTVNEWKAKFALPVRSGAAMLIEQQVHKSFKQFRVDSDQGSSREFFKLDPFIAFSKVREVGSIHRVGEDLVF